MKRPRLLWALMRQHSESVMAWPAAIHRGVLVGLLVALGAGFGDLPYGAAAGFGALSVGLVPPGISRSLLVRICLGVAVLSASAGFAVQLVAGTWWLLLLLPLLGYVYGTVGGNGLLAFNLTLGPLATAVGLSGIAPMTLSHVTVSALAILAGGLIATSAAVMTWPRERITEVRRAVTASLCSLLELVRSEQASPGLHLHGIDIAARAMALVDSAGLPQDRRQYFSDVLDQIYETRVVVSSWLMNAQPDPLHRGAVVVRLEAITRSFQHPAEPPQQDTGVVPPELTAALGDLDAAVTSSLSPASKTRAVRVGSDEPTLRSWFTHLPSSLAIGAPGARQGLRIALALAVATAISLWFGIPHGYWIAMSALMVMKSDFASTLSQGLLRVAGTVVAVVAVSAVFAMIGDVGWVYAVLIMIAAPLVMRWMTVNYFWASIAMATTMLLLSEAQTPSLGPPEARLLATLLGCGIALIVFLVLPNWRGSELVAVLTGAIRAQFDWTTEVLAALADPSPLDKVRLRELDLFARRALSTAVPVTTAALIEPHRTKCDPLVGTDLVTTIGWAGLATMALQRVLQDGAGLQRDWFRSDEFSAVRGQVQDCFNTALTNLDADGEGAVLRETRTTEQKLTMPVYVARLLDASSQLSIDSQRLIRSDSGRTYWCGS
ncbi:MAG: FUSC family protein [Actinomycetota bacterium]|nr:FUSC family protein [Actinomycetota bacterium]